HADEVRRGVYVGGGWGPVEALAPRGGEGAPPLGAPGDLAVLVLEQLPADRLPPPPPALPLRRAEGAPEDPRPLRVVAGGARGTGRCAGGPRGRRRRPAAGTPGSWRAPRRGPGPRSYGCR